MFLLFFFFSSEEDRAARSVAEGSGQRGDGRGDQARTDRSWVIEEHLGQASRPGGHCLLTDGWVEAVGMVAYERWGQRWLADRGCSRRRSWRPGWSPVVVAGGE